MIRGKGALPHTRAFRQHGYTVVEVMIFLAVSAALFISTMLLLSGKQQKAQFSNSVRDFETRLTDIANDVSNGYYETNSNVKCTAGSITAGAQAEGTNDECIFLGRFIKLGVGNGTSANKERFTVYSLVGRRESSPGTDVQTFTQANARLLLTGDATTDGVLSDEVSFGDGAEVVCVTVGTGACMDNNMGFAFVTQLTGGVSANAPGGAIKAELRQKSLTLAQQVVNTTTVSDMSQLSNTSLTICVKSGGSDQYALIKIGNQNGTNTTISSLIKSYSGGTPPCN